MKKRMIKLIAVLSAAFMSITSVSTGLLNINNIETVDAATKVTLNKTKLTISEGKYYTLKFSNSKNVKWTSFNKKVATVSSKGKVTALKKGSSTITVKADNNKKCT